MMASESSPDVLPGISPIFAAAILAHTTPLPRHSTAAVSSGAAPCSFRGDAASAASSASCIISQKPTTSTDLHRRHRSDFGWIKCSRQQALQACSARYACAESAAHAGGLHQFDRGWQAVAVQETIGRRSLAARDRHGRKPSVCADFSKTCSMGPDLV